MSNFVQPMLTTPRMLFRAIGVGFAAASIGCLWLVLRHAFRRSVGTGFLVLCLPLYSIYYGFSQFEHQRKGLILAGWLGTLILAVVFRLLQYPAGGG